MSVIFINQNCVTAVLKCLLSFGGRMLKFLVTEVFLTEQVSLNDCTILIKLILTLIIDFNIYKRKSVEFSSFEWSECCFLNGQLPKMCGQIEKFSFCRLEA